MNRRFVNKNTSLVSGFNLNKIRLEIDHSNFMKEKKIIWWWINTPKWPMEIAMQLYLPTHEHGDGQPRATSQSRHRRDWPIQLYVIETVILYDSFSINIHTFTPATSSALPTITPSQPQRWLSGKIRIMTSYLKKPRITLWNLDEFWEWSEEKIYDLIWVITQMQI